MSLIIAGWSTIQCCECLPERSVSCYFTTENEGNNILYLRGQRPLFENIDNRLPGDIHSYGYSLHEEHYGYSSSLIHTVAILLKRFNPLQTVIGIIHGYVKQRRVGRQLGIIYEKEAGLPRFEFIGIIIHLVNGHHWLTISSF